MHLKKNMVQDRLSYVRNEVIVFRIIPKLAKVTKD